MKGRLFSQGDNIYQTSIVINQDHVKNLTKKSKAHMMHKPYTNDFAKCLEKIEKEGEDGCKS